MEAFSSSNGEFKKNQSIFPIIYNFRPSLGHRLSPLAGLRRSDRRRCCASEAAEPRSFSREEEGAFDNVHGDRAAARLRLSSSLRLAPLEFISSFGSAPGVMAAPAHLARVRSLYKRILVLHRFLPDDLKALGDGYVRDEFRRHKTAAKAEVARFLTEWEVKNTPKHG